MRFPLSPAQRLIVAADVPTIEELQALVEQLAGTHVTIKIGLELSMAIGCPLAIKTVRDAGLSVMYDGKFNDIPNTIAAASRAIAKQGVASFTVHACSGPEGLVAATKHAGESQVVGVTVLTSLDEKQARNIFGLMPDAKVLNFAQDLLEAQAHAVVCSPHEAELLRGMSKFDALKIITPGIRPEWAKASHDQKRVMTPEQALAAGVDRLVIGRPIMQYPDGPKAAVERLIQDITHTRSA